MKNIKFKEIKVYVVESDYRTYNLSKKVRTALVVAGAQKDVMFEFYQEISQCSILESVEVCSRWVTLEGVVGPISSIRPRMHSDKGVDSKSRHDRSPKRIVEMRAAGMSQGLIAKCLGVNKSYISRVLKQEVSGGR